VCHGKEAAKRHDHGPCPHGVRACAGVEVRGGVTTDRDGENQVWSTHVSGGGDTCKRKGHDSMAGNIGDGVCAATRRGTTIQERYGRNPWSRPRPPHGSKVGFTSRRKVRRSHVVQGCSGEAAVKRCGGGAAQSSGKQRMQSGARTARLP
jgi:hypothetical protein